MTIKARMEEWQVAVSNCAIYIKELAGATESATHSMTAFEYRSKPMPMMYRQPGTSLTGFEHAIADLQSSRKLINLLEDTRIIHTPPGLYEAYAKLIRLAQDKGWDESIMDSAYSKIIEFLVYLAPDDIAEACVPKGDNPGNPGEDETYIDPYDIEVLERWLKLAKKEGTKAIRIIASPVEVYAKYGATHLVTVESPYPF